MTTLNETMAMASNSTSSLMNNTKNITLGMTSSKVPVPEKDNGGLPMWVPLVAIIVTLFVIALVVYFKRRGKYDSLRDSLMPASNWRLSASSLGLMSADPADASQPPITPLSIDSTRTANWEQQFFDDDAVYRPSTTVVGGSGGYGGGDARGGDVQIATGSQQIVSPTRLQLDFSPLRI